MYSISEVVKLTNLTARALRHYEDKGLITTSRRAQNGYRYYSQEVLTKIASIKKLKKMEFSLDEIFSLFKLQGDDLENLLSLKLDDKLLGIEAEINRLVSCKQEVKTQMLATNNFFKGKVLSKDQRRVLMETIKSEVLEQLKLKKSVGHKDLEYLRREDSLFDTPEKREFIDAIKKCLSFANKERIKLGPARGAAPALLSLYALGWSDFDPVEHNLVPERFSTTDFCLHIDVEFKNGKKFIDYCKSITCDLKIGSIEAFKLPILDIIENVNKRLPKPIDYDSINDNDPLVLNQFKQGDIKHIFSFDIPKDTLLAKNFDSHYYRDGKATQMLSAYLKSQDVFDFKDLLNIEAIFRPDNLDKQPFMREYIDRYPLAKKNGFNYACLTSSLNEFLKPNYGVIIYQEDIIQIIHEYTLWDFDKCNEFRKQMRDSSLTKVQEGELLEHMHQDVLDLLLVESLVAFCKAHSVGAWPKLIKKTAILKSLYPDIYLDEIEKWQKENGYSWGDFGIVSGGVSLLQQ
ncbi:MAG: MerR family transcriptional regulator [Halobacteriovoraceae bacterium]|jgi:MerR family transcriptional regulator, copper efflux regulator|nr:MerR family transcriptional regulator [Halobacteriovoraceae bacterium]